MQLVLSLANGVSVTATPFSAPDGTVGLDFQAATPAGPMALRATTTQAAVRNMIALGKAKFGPKIAAYLNRVLGVHGEPPLPASPTPVSVDAFSGPAGASQEDASGLSGASYGEQLPPSGTANGGVGNPFAGLTDVGEGSASAGLWAYGPYAVTVPVRYRVLRPWRFRPWWWPTAWAWSRPIYPLPFGGFAPYPPPPGYPQWTLPWYLRTDAAGLHFPPQNPPAGGSSSVAGRMVPRNLPRGASIGRGRGGGANLPWRPGYGASIGQGMEHPAPIAATPVGQIPATATNGLAPAPVTPLPWWQWPLVAPLVAPLPYAAVAAPGVPPAGFRATGCQAATGDDTGPLTVFWFAGDGGLYTFPQGFGAAPVPVQSLVDCTQPAV